MRALFLLSWLALIIAVPTPSSAVSCRRYCKPAIARCAEAGYRRRACTQQLVRACKQLGRTACDVAFVLPSTTVTTSTTTSTTTTPPPTLPVWYDGTWIFDSAVSWTGIPVIVLEDGCGITTQRIEVMIAVADSGVAVRTVLGETTTSWSVTGTSTDGPPPGAGWSVGAEVCGNGCCAHLGIAAGPAGVNVAVADLRYAVSCADGSGCVTAGMGPLLR